MSKTVTIDLNLNTNPANPEHMSQLLQSKNEKK